MPSRQNILFLFSLLAALALGAGCSSSQTAGDDSYLDMGGSPESGADAVGSIPEDMLASEEANMAGIEEGADAADAMADSATTVDPFADLAETESNTDALEVVEDGGSGASGSTDTYTVKSGDTLMKIAFTIYGDIDRWKDLRDWNRTSIKNASQLKVGSKLTYEVPLRPFSAEELSHSYLIKQGDTLAGIADEVYGRKMKYRKLQNYNKSLIKNPNRIFAGFTIYYDITDQEMAEAEARRQERIANGGFSAPSNSFSSSSSTSAAGAAEDSFDLLAPSSGSSLPSALTPPSAPATGSRSPVAISPSGVSPIAPPAGGSVKPIAPPAN